MGDVDMAWDEDRGGPRHADNLVSFPQDGQFYLSTKNVLDWRKCGTHDTARMVVPAVFVEKLFKMAPDKDPSELQEHLFLVKALVIAWMAPALGLLMGQGLCTVDGDDTGDADTYEYETPNALQAEADKLVLQLANEEVMQVTRDSFEWLEGINEQV